MMVTLYSKPQCVQCDMTQRVLDNRGVEYRKVDITQDSDAFELVTGMGYKQAPVVVFGDTHWSGFQPDLIATIP